MMVSRGWSLKELLIAVAIMVALVALLLPIGLRVRTAVKRADCKTRIATLGAWLVQEYSRTGSLPITEEEFEALARRAGVEPRCPFNGEPYQYYAAFMAPYGADGTPLPDTHQLRREWKVFITNLLKSHRYHPMLQCEHCYDPKLSGKVVEHGWSGRYRYPIFSNEVKIKDRRFLGVNFYGCVGYYNDVLLLQIITLEWTCRSGYNPGASRGGRLSTREEVNELERAIQQGGGSGCW
ncbi:MAG: hypothetical protein WHT28_04125 [Fimbriimonadales bacterium]